MTEQVVLYLAREALTTCLLVSAPILVAAMVVGLAIGIFQAMTQINEVTLTFVPKILAVFLAVGLLGTWMMRTMLDYTIKMMSYLPLLAAK